MLSRSNYPRRPSRCIRREPWIAVRIPDVTVFDAAELRVDHESSEGKGYVWIGPKLVIECLSTGNRKGSIHQLLADYESAGSAEVWLIEPEKHAVASYRMFQGRLAEV